MTIEDIRNYPDSIYDPEDDFYATLKAEANTVADFIENDGFDIADFRLTQVVNGYWEFYKDKVDRDRPRGFLVIYDSDIETVPKAGYSLHNGCVYLPYEARNITEAYLLHELELSDEDYELANTVHNKECQNERVRISDFAQKHGSKATAEKYGLTEKEV